MDVMVKFQEHEFVNNRQLWLTGKSKVLQFEKMAILVWIDVVGRVLVLRGDFELSRIND